MFNYHWRLKKGLSDKITDKQIDNFYKDLIYKYQILGGKLIGAGGGGFFLVCVNNKKKICKILDEDRVNYIDFDIEKNGSKVLYS
jgi:D-glycero-alpha-D-manno-heptose-7-phosphate kinase